MKMFGDVTKGLKRQKRALARQLKQIDGVLTRLAKIEGKKVKRGGGRVSRGGRKRVSARNVSARKAKQAVKVVAHKAKAKAYPPVIKAINTDLEAKRRRAAELKPNRTSDSGE